MHLARRSLRVPFTKVLLSYQLVLVFVVFVLLAAGIFFLAFFDTAAARRVSATVPRAIGHVNMFVLAVLFVPVSRTSPVMRWLGFRYETAIQMHTVLGRCFMIFVLAHSATMVGFWASGAMGSLIADRLVGMVAAFVGLAAVAVMAAVSWFRVVRHLAFEVFYFAHHLFVVVVAASCVHAMAMMVNSDGSVNWNQDLPIYYLAVPFIVYALDRLLRIVKSVRPVELASLEVHGDVVKLRLTCAEHSQFFPGSFAFLCCPSVSRVEWHPLSASAIDRRTNSVEFDVMRVGGANSWSSRLFESAQRVGASFTGSTNLAGLDQTGSDVELLFEESLAFRVDGPYGDDLRLEEYTGVLFVAGGIGLTSLMPIYSEYARSDKNIRFVYLFRRNSFSAHDEFFARVENRDHFVFVQTQENDLGGDEGRPSQEWPHSVVTRGKRPAIGELAGDVAGRVCVVCCGPAGLARDAELMAHERGWDFVNLSFFY
jgi:predicted ferric reductase